MRERPSPQPEDLSTRLGLAPFGLRFVDSETERAFSTFHALNSLNAFRIGVIGSLAAWCIGSMVAARIFPAYAKQYFVAGWVLMAPLLSLAFYLSRRSWWVPRLAWWSGGLNVLAGILVVLIMDFDDSVLRGVGLGLIILVAFFSFTIFRLRLFPSLVTVLVYYSMFQAKLTIHYLNGSAGTIEHAGYSFVLWITFGVGAFVVANLERGWRQAFVQSRIIDDQQERIRLERARSEALLLNILPEPIAERLKYGESTIADAFGEATVLFADIVGFTPLSQQVSPDRLVEILNHIFSEFDELTVEIGVEKIKTIGDAYMVAAGVPTMRHDHTEAIAQLALRMLEAVANIRAEKGIDLEIRIGIHSGPVVAGVIGKRKFAYDLWGDTVNTAARMESHGCSGKIQVSEEVRARLADHFVLDDRGTIEVKGKGPMRTYFLREEIA